MLRRYMTSAARSGVSVWRAATGIAANALTGNAFARLERSMDETRQIAEENRRLLRGLHDTLKDQTLAAHLLAQRAATNPPRDDAP